MVQNRWKKKPATKRKEMLLKVWPDMPATHRPDFRLLRLHKGKVQSMDKKHGATWLCPHINQEDLSDPQNLPVFLQSRAGNAPHLFAALDSELMDLGRATMAITPLYLPGFRAMNLDGSIPQKNYGRLIAQQSTRGEGSDQVQFPVGQGLQIMRSQSMTWKFCVDICTEILHDIPQNEMCSSKYPILLQTPLQESSNGSHSPGIITRQAPYKVPGKPDLDKIESLISARVMQAQDHIVSLREDPHYFVEVLDDISQHCVELLKDDQGNLGLTTQKDRDLLQAEVISRMLTEAYFGLEGWTELQGQVAGLRKLYTKYRDSLSPNHVLPHDFSAELLKFTYELHHLTNHVLAQLAEAAPASRPLRQHFRRCTKAAPNPSEPPQTGFKIHEKAKMGLVESQLIWLLQVLWDNGHDLSVYGPTVIIDELDRLLGANNTKTEASNLLSSHVAKIISDISIIGECLREVELFQPWARQFKHRPKKDIVQENPDRARAWRKTVKEAFKTENCFSFLLLADTTGGRFDYPIDKRRDNANVLALQKAERNLDAFFEKADSLLWQKAQSEGAYRDSVFFEAYYRFLSLRDNLQRTPDWVEPVIEKRGEGKNELYQDQKPDLSTDQCAVFSSNLFHSTGPEASTGTKILAAAASQKQKVKRRGEASPAPAGKGDLLHSAVSPGDGEPTIEVDAKTKKVIDVLFFNQGARDMPGEVAWLAFTHAMSPIGFGARKLYGSVWHFEPTMPHADRSIQFHEPHPHPKIPFLVVRRFGGRLTRAYGWSSSTFVLKGKNS
ncbi:hypothetical protein F5Y16DRAFT_411449 [Xylariaceae sp. FL0255]|nr:hypothetical protein F5Y16DRAFT_411449 [Xylariaceae sp. FL0255]